MKRALVLSGGGARGAYQVGVWRALRELEIKIDIVTGTSVGCLNAMLVVQQDYSLAKEMWERLTYQEVISGATDQRQDAIRAILKGGGADVFALKQTLESVYSPEKFYASPIDFGLVTVEYPSFRPVTLTKSEIEPERLCDYLMASAACFPAFKSWEIEGRRYVDGGYYDNMPLRLAEELGAEEIIAVDLQNFGRVLPLKNPEIPVTLIRHPHCGELGSILEFEPQRARQNLRIGYLDAMKAFGRLEGERFSFYRGERKRLMQPQAGAYERLFCELFLSRSQADTTYYYMLVRLNQVLGVARSDGRLVLSKALGLSMEAAAGSYRLDPYTVYTAQSMEAALSEASSGAGTLSQAVGRLLTGSTMSLKEKLAFVQKLDRAKILNFLTFCIGEYLKGNFSYRRLSRLMLLFPRLSLGALYLLCRKGGMFLGQNANLYEHSVSGVVFPDSPC